MIQVGSEVQIISGCGSQNGLHATVEDIDTVSGQTRYLLTAPGLYGAAVPDTKRPWVDHLYVYSDMVEEI